MSEKADEGAPLGRVPSPESGRPYDDWIAEWCGHGPDSEIHCICAILWQFAMQVRTSALADSEERLVKELNAAQRWNTEAYGCNSHTAEHQQAYTDGMVAGIEHALDLIRAALPTVTT